MTDPIFDDFGRQPGKRVDPDIGLAESRATFEQTPLEQLHAAEEMAARYFDDKVARQVLGSGPESAIVVDDQNAFSKLTQAAAEDAAKATAQAPSEVPAQAPDSRQNETGFDVAGDDAKSPAKAAKPSSVESALASIQLDTGRQERFVILGDDAVTQRFYNKLAERGKLLYQGNTPVIGVDRKEALKLLKEAASEVPGATAQHALKLDMDRTGFSALGSVKAGVANMLGRRHEIDVVVVGSQATVESKLKELGGLVEKLDNDKLLSNKDGVTVRDGALAPPETGPATLKGSVKLYDLVSSVQETVRAYTAQSAEQDQARKDFRNAKEDRAIAESKGPSAATEQSTGSAPAQPLNRFAAERAQELSATMTSSASVLAQTDSGQSAGAAALHRMMALKDPASPELATLPDGDRQKAIVQTLALAAKADAKELPDVHKGQPVDASVSDKSRDKMLSWVAEEVARDSTFPAKAQALTAELVERGILSNDQASRMLSDAGLAARTTSSTAPSRAESERPGDSMAGTQSSTRQDSGSGTANTSTAASQARTERTDTDATGAISANGQDASGVREGSSTSASIGAQQGGRTGSVSASAGAAHSAAESPSVASTDSPGQQAKPTSSAPEALRDRLESMTRPGALVTAAQVSGVIAELDARRTQPLSSLDAGEGSKPTETLARIQTVLEHAESGRFGKSLAAQASDLRSAVDAWGKQDQARVGVTESATPVASTSKPEAAGASQSTGSVADRPAGVPESTRGTPESATPVQPQVSSDAARSRDAGVTSGSSVSASEGATQAGVGAQAMATAAAYSQLSQSMANPAGTFTNRDKTWNEQAFIKAATEVTRMDPEAVSKMSPRDQVAAAAYSAWLGDALQSGKVVRGTDTGDLARQVTERAATIIQNLPEGASMSPSVAKEMTRAESMMNAMGTRESNMKEQSAVSASAPSRNLDSTALAKDVIHAVYKETELSESYVKYLLKNASQLTPDSIKSMDPESKAQTAAALNFLVGEVRQGALGDFGSLSSETKKNVMSAQQAADTLNTEFAKDPRLSTELIKANIALTAIAPAEGAVGSAKPQDKGVEKPAPTPDRGMGR